VTARQRNLVTGFSLYTRKHWFQGDGVKLPTFGNRDCRRNDGALGTPGFTLIELLVVIAIIGILASMMLPSLSGAKQRGKIILCINNLRQMGLAIQMYVDDHNQRFPLATVTQLDPVTGQPMDSMPRGTLQTLGGREPLNPGCFPNARSRPLWAYVKPSDVFRCPDDRGQRILPCNSDCGPGFAPSNFKTVGMSYQYNGGTPLVLSGGGFQSWKNSPTLPATLAGQSEGWIPDPSRFIVMHEPPARIYGCVGSGPRWYQWHFAAGGPAEFVDPRVAPSRFVSPVLFADGHTKQHNFTRALTADPLHPYEPTADWMWYKGPDK